MFGKTEATKAECRLVLPSEAVVAASTLEKSAAACLALLFLTAYTGKNHIFRVFFTRRCNFFAKSHK